MKKSLIILFAALFSQLAFTSSQTLYSHLWSPHAPLLLKKNSIGQKLLEDRAKVFFETQHYLAIQFERTGHYQIPKEGLFSSEKNLNLFVPPLVSLINENPHTYWYKTQFETGTPSNCGPANISMAIAWSKGIDVPVYDIRVQIGWSTLGKNDPEAISMAVEDYMSDPNRQSRTDNGGTSLVEIVSMLNNYHVPHQFKKIQSQEDLFSIIDSGNIAIALFRAGDISYKSSTDDNLFGRHYQYQGGHYAIIKGYSIDKEYLIVSDPMPSDWYQNSYRHPDGISMIGRTRYYKTSELLPSLKADAIEIFKEW